MSQTIEESEKCDLQELEEQLKKLKACGDYIKKSYKEIKHKYDAIIEEKDQNTEKYKNNYHKIVKLLKNNCTEAIKLVKTLDENDFNKNTKTKETEKECLNTKKDQCASENKENKNKEQINIEEDKIKDFDKGESSSSSSSSISIGGSTRTDSHNKEMLQTKNKKQTQKCDSANNAADKLQESDITHQNDKESSKNESENICKNPSPQHKTKDKENLDKENEKPTENSIVEIEEQNKDPPKGIIRVISIEKLLDPNIVALQKRSTTCSNLLNSSVIVLDSDDDDDDNDNNDVPPLPIPVVVPQKNPPLAKDKINEARKKNVDKTNAAAAAAPAVAPKTSKELIYEKNSNDYTQQMSDKEIQKNFKLKKVSVKLKSSKYLREMLNEKRLKIKLSKLKTGLDSEPELNNDSHTTKAKRLHQQENSVQQQQQQQNKGEEQKMSSISDEDDNDNDHNDKIGRRRKNVKAT